MKPHYYTCERNAQIVIALLKAHNIRKIIASPGATNIAFVASVQIDPYFEIYSCVDERSAAYMACGLAAESGEPVVLSCTGATSSRNYMPALTEAYYRKLPILAITSSRGENLIGHLKPQVTDRTCVPNDIVVEHVTAPLVTDARSEMLCNLEVNKAILALYHHGGGPAHINLLTLTPSDFSVKSIAPVRAIYRHENTSQMPLLPNGNIAIFIGAHRTFTEEETLVLNVFCKKYNAVILRDHTSGYYGSNSIMPSLLLAQNGYNGVLKHIDLIIHLGGICGCYYMNSIKPKEVWRVCVDGSIQDFFGTLSHVFEMEEIGFFTYYSHIQTDGRHLGDSLFSTCQADYEHIMKQIPDLPLSNIWVASQLHNKLPQNSVLHLGILNSLRSWNFFTLDKTILSNCNVGGFGIDGILSTAVGSSLADPEKIHYCILGDLAFFYDMNALGNRHIANNLRIIVINNGLGQEFKNPSFETYYGFKDGIDPYIGAAGHFGRRNNVLKHFSQDMGFEYMYADTKDQVLKYLPYFTQSKETNSPILFEIRTETPMETKALQLISNVIPLPYHSIVALNAKKTGKAIFHNVLPHLWKR